MAEIEVKKYIPNKTPVTNTHNIFDLKILLEGDSGSGKTHLCGTYTLGPIHFYMFDKGGIVTVKKLMKNRPASSPVTYDDFSSKEMTFSKCWDIVIKDEKEGLFDYLAENNGIVIVDSITSANVKAVREIAKLDNRTPPLPGKVVMPKKKFDFVHWTQLESWITGLIEGMQETPCASICTVHLSEHTNDDGAVIARRPAVNGKLQNLISINYDEVYNVVETNGKYVTHFKDFKMVKAGTRAFSCKKIENLNLTTLAKAYLKGDLLEKMV